MKPGSVDRESLARISREFAVLYHDLSEQTLASTNWLGAPIVKTPMDIVALQEVVAETRPELIIETGVFGGGGALYFASLLDLLGIDGKVIAIDVSLSGARPQVVRHERVELLEGSSVDPAIVDRLKGEAEGRRVMVDLDSDHRAEHVRAELEVLAPLVTPGCYLVVEDTWLGGRPVRPHDAPGPSGALESWLAEGQPFQIDRWRERFLLTGNAGGYLRRLEADGSLVAPPGRLPEYAVPDRIAAPVPGSENGGPTTRRAGPARPRFPKPRPLASSGRLGLGRLRRQARSGVTQRGMPGLVYGCAIASEAKFRRCAKAGVRKASGRDARMIELRGRDCLFRAYNEILEQVAGDSSVEALVLLHEDTEIRDDRFERKVRETMADDSVAIAGAVGGFGVQDIDWWYHEGGVGSVTQVILRTGEAFRTRVIPPMERLVGVPSSGEVDVVDGFLLVLSRWAIDELRFDEDLGPGFHGYDADICFQARERGKKVVAMDLDVAHHRNSTMPGAARESWKRTHVAFRRKWESRWPLAPPPWLPGGDGR